MDMNQSERVWFIVKPNYQVTVGEVAGFKI